MPLKYGPYSPSRIEASTCPHRFYREYIKCDAEAEKIAASNRGSAVHDMFEEITKRWMQDKRITWQEVQGMLPKIMAQYFITSPDLQKEILKTTECYLRNPPPINTGDIYGTEEALAVKRVEGEDLFEECEWDDPQCFARGKLDILLIKDNVATIIDHKTQKNIPKRQDTFQMGVYAWIVKQIFPQIKEVKTILHFCDYRLNYYGKPVTWTERDLEIKKDELQFHIDVIENIDNFEHTNAGAHCTYCPVIRECPRLKKSLENKLKYNKVPIESASKAVDKASTLKVLEENKGVLQKELKDYTQTIGSVEITGYEYGYKTSSGYEVPIANKKKLYELLISQGVDVWAYLDFDIKKLSKNAWKGLGAAEIEEITKLIRPVKSSRCGWSKV